MNATNEQIKDAITRIAELSDASLLALTADEIAAEWEWQWEKNRSIESNVYSFTDILELHKRRWERWENHHNGSCCVVERVRDKYVMPRIREFLTVILTELVKEFNQSIGLISLVYVVSAACEPIKIRKGN